VGGSAVALEAAARGGGHLRPLPRHQQIGERLEVVDAVGEHPIAVAGHASLRQLEGGGADLLDRRVEGGALLAFDRREFRRQRPRPSSGPCLPRSASRAHSARSERPPSTMAFCLRSILRTSACSTMGICGLRGSRAASGRPCGRVRAYSSDSWYAALAVATPFIPTIRRASFIIWNMCPRPWCGVPTTHPTQSPRSPKLSAMLGMPRQPILW